MNTQEAKAAAMRARKAAVAWARRQDPAVRVREAEAKRARRQADHELKAHEAGPKTSGPRTESPRVKSLYDSKGLVRMSYGFPNHFQASASNIIHFVDMVGFFFDASLEGHIFVGWGPLQSHKCHCYCQD